MRYLKDTFSYLFIRGKGKRFAILFLFALIPSAMLAYGVRSETFLVNLISPPVYENWADVLLSYFPSTYGLISAALGVICSIIATACIMGAVIRHFRVGDFSVGQISRSFNDYALPAVFYTAMCVAIYAVAFIVYSLFAYMWYCLTSAVAYAVLSVIALIILASVTVYCMSSLTMWLPLMCVKGIYSHNALSSAFYQSRSKQKFFLPGHITIALIVLCSSVISYFVSDIWYASWIVDSIGYAIAYAFSLIFITTAFFGENRLPREDVGVSPYKRRF